jgi:uncharacterized protein (TIGR00369 family)
LPKKLHGLLEECLQHASDADIQMIEQLLDGVRKKLSSKNNSYLEGIFQMEQTLTQNECELKMPLSELTNNPLDITHGGITSTLIDSAMGALANAVLPENLIAVTTGLNVHFIAAGSGEFLKCNAKIDHKGHSTMILSAEVYRSDGKKTAQATAAFYILNKHKG